jgi:4-hydroxy-3-polyprenylbenzoate decarboxylase
MAYSGLKEFIHKLEQMGELKRISYPADPCLEITEIADRVMKSGRPALLPSVLG